MKTLLRGPDDRVAWLHSTTNMKRVRSIAILLVLQICFSSVGASHEIVSHYTRSANESNGHAQFTSVVSMDFCYSCLQENTKGYKKSYKELPVYAVLSNDQKASFGPSFTICSSAIKKGGPDQLFFTLLGENGDRAIQASLLNRVESATLFLTLGKGIAHLPNISVPLNFPNQWVHSCLAISSLSGQVQWVIDGRIVENTTLEVLKEVSQNIPKNLTGNLILGAGKFASGWFSIGNKVTGLNIFSSILSLDEMVKMTHESRNHCNNKGSYLQWANMQWTLHGKAKLVNVPAMEPCKEESLIKVYYTKFTKMTDCMHHCQKLGGQSPTIVDMTAWQNFQFFMENNLYEQYSNVLDGFWLPITDDEEEGVWKDYYTEEVLQYDGPFIGGHPNGGVRENCAIQVSSTLWIDWTCETRDEDFFCVCGNKEKHFLKLRGLCQYSRIDSLFMPRNTRQDIRQLEYIGQSGTIIHFKQNQKEWVLQVLDNFEVKTQGTSASPLVSFALGKHQWEIENDTFECGTGGSYKADLKLTGCKEDEFTCDDGQCINMAKRCNNLPNCKDKSDEIGCSLWKFEKGYNLQIPPIRMIKDSFDLVEVQISVILMKVISINEEKNKIDLQFEIGLQWYENRITYNNLKTETALNVLKSKEQKEFWLPLVIYDNTDQKETTTLGMQDEWSTEVNVVRKGNFTRSGLDSVDEVEMFRGDENPLMMKQVYTHQFQCKYDLERYPFDTQHCTIEMVLGNYDVKMVRLVPSNFSMNEHIELALFTITSWNLEYRSPFESQDGLIFRIVLKRKVVNSLLTTYLPSILLILITFATTYFKSIFFEAALTANLTIMLVTTTIFIGSMQMLPTTAYIKMVDIWLVFCQLVPFTEVILLTAMEYHREDVSDGNVGTSLEADKRKLNWLNIAGEYKLRVIPLRVVLNHQKSEFCLQWWVCSLSLMQ